MDDSDVVMQDQAQDEGKRRAAQEAMRLKVAFGDDVAQRFLRLRGIVGDAMQEAVLVRYANKQADRMARNAIAQAAYTPPLQALAKALDAALQGDDEVDLADMI